MFIVHHQAFQCVQMTPESLEPLRCGLVTGVGFSPNKLLFDPQVARFFQGPQMAGEIAIGKLQVLLQKRKTDAIMLP